MNYVTLENSQHNTQNKEKVKSTSNYTLLINSDKAGLFKSSFSSGGKGGGGRFDPPLFFQEELI